MGLFKKKDKRYINQLDNYTDKLDFREKIER